MPEKKSLNPNFFSSDIRNKSRKFVKQKVKNFGLVVNKVMVALKFYTGEY